MSSQIFVAMSGRTYRRHSRSCVARWDRDHEAFDGEPIRRQEPGHEFGTGVLGVVGVEAEPGEHGCEFVRQRGSVGGSDGAAGAVGVVPLCAPARGLGAGRVDRDTLVQEPDRAAGSVANLHDAAERFPGVGAVLAGAVWASRRFASGAKSSALMDMVRSTGFSNRV